MAEIYGDKTGGGKTSHRNWLVLGLIVAIALVIIIALAQRYG